MFEDEVILDNIENILEEIVHFFRKLHSKPLGNSWSLEGLNWSPISIKKVAWLDHPFLEEEVYNVAFQLRKRHLGIRDSTLQCFRRVGM